MIKTVIKFQLKYLFLIPILRLFIWMWEPGAKPTNKTYLHQKIVWELRYALNEIEKI